MSARRNPRSSQLVRGFLMGMLCAKGHILTSARIRSELRVSRATAKRDMRAIAGVVPVSESKPLTGMLNSAPRRTRRLAQFAEQAEERVA